MEILVYKSFQVKLRSNLDGLRWGFPKLSQPMGACARPSFNYARQNKKNKESEMVERLYQ